MSSDNVCKPLKRKSTIYTSYKFVGKDSITYWAFYGKEFSR
ncbi:MAG: hypothetical protein ACE5SW_10915 [Nitrososphaeraceae archaeon]